VRAIWPKLPRSPEIYNATMNLATSQENIPLLEAILDKGVGWNWRDEHGWTLEDSLEAIKHPKDRAPEIYENCSLFLPPTILNGADRSSSVIVEGNSASYERKNADCKRPQSINETWTSTDFNSWIIESRPSDSAHASILLRGHYREW
jgi:hypothetical protein